MNNTYSICYQYKPMKENLEMLICAAETIDEMIEYLLDKLIDSLLLVINILFLHDKNFNKKYKHQMFLTDEIIYRIKRWHSGKVKYKAKRYRKER